MAFCFFVLMRQLLCFPVSLPDQVNVTLRGLGAFLRFNGLVGRVLVKPLFSTSKYSCTRTFRMATIFGQGTPGCAA